MISYSTMLIVSCPDRCDHILGCVHNLEESSHGKYNINIIISQFYEY